MATSTVQFNGTVDNIESNVNKVHTYDGNLSDSAAETEYLSIKGLTDFINKIFPIGMIVSFDTDVDPNDIYGGTWERVKGRFIWGIGDNETAGTTGGEKEHILTGAEMPEHIHIFKSFYDGSIPAVTGNQQTNRMVYAEGATTTISNACEVAGGSEPHNNMPPYYGAYIWRRIA